MSILSSKPDPQKLIEFMRNMKESDAEIVIEELRKSDMEPGVREWIIKTVRAMLKQSQLAKKHDLI